MARYSGLTGADKEAYLESFADIFTRLVTQDCRAEAELAFKYEGAVAAETSFQLLGQVAMEDLMTNPRVDAYFGSLESYIDEDDFDGITLQAH